jgi:hypothetical protein
MQRCASHDESSQAIDDLRLAGGSVGQEADVARDSASDK